MFQSSGCACLAMAELITHLRFERFLACVVSGDVQQAREGKGNLFNTLLAAIEPKKSTTTTAATTAAATTTAATTGADTTAATTAEATTASSK